MKTLLMGLMLVIVTPLHAQYVSVGGLMGVDTSRGSYSPPLAENVNVPYTMNFKILDVSAEGCRVMDTWTDKDYFIRGITGYSDRNYSETVVADGSYTYTTVLGSIRRIPAFKKITEEEKDAYYRQVNAARKAAQEAEHERQVQERVEAIHAANLKAIAAEIQREEKRELAKQAIIRFRLQQATNGSSYYQYVIGSNYLNGTDGFITNKALGMYWVTKAQTNDIK